MQRRCESCEAELSRFAISPTCATCDASAAPPPVLPTRPTPSAVWLWAGREASAALSTRDLSVILKTYRTLNGLSQDGLAAILGYDKSYVSLIENRRRTISDVPTRRHIAHTLGLPPHVLDVTDTADADFAAMLQFGDSTIRLAEIARQAGRAVDAVNELWPLTARLEARAAEGHLDRDALILLGQARVALGVSLGTVLPEERLAVAARWTSKALIVAQHLGDRAFLAHTLRMHGNELRKADHQAAAVARLEHAVHLADDPIQRGSALALLARATGETGNPETFDHAIAAYRALLDQHTGEGILFNPFTFHEIHLRGLIATGRAAEAATRVQDSPPPDSAVPAPQWRVIERVTAGHALLAADATRSAKDALRNALITADAHRLPHQIQRILRISRDSNLHPLDKEAEAALTGLRASLALPQQTTPPNSSPNEIPSRQG
jgi:transcriptional regulator with XRE-family HTH domain